jgi:hypothetical protein
MPFDPLSVLGYIGTTAGLIGFLVSTVTRLEKFGRDYKDCGPQLGWYRSKLKTIEWTLIAWKRLWCHEGQRPYLLEDYVHFWGRSGYEEMETKWRLIEEEIQAVGLLLYSGWEKKLSVNSCDKRAIWQQRAMLKQQLMDSDKQFVPSLTWLQKICFASYKGANLEERTKRLKDKVDDLKEFSRLAYWNAQYTLDVDSPVTQAELNNLLQRKRWFDEQADYLNQLYLSCQQSSHIWSLVLSAPDDEANLSLIDDQRDVTIDFDVFRSKTGLGDGDRLAAAGILSLSCFQMQQMPIVKIIQDLNEYDALQIPVQWSTDLKEILSQGKAEYQRLLQRYGLDHRRTRADTAVGLVNWTVLLWRTRWTLGLCSCRIRYAFLDAMGNGNATFTSMPCQLFPGICHVVDNGFKARRSLLLGVSLAELALSTPIEIMREESAQLVFVMNEDVISESELLDRVKSTCCNDFKLAIQYCFFYDKKAPDTDYLLPAKDAALFQENVLDL